MLSQAMPCILFQQHCCLCLGSIMNGFMFPVFTCHKIHSCACSFLLGRCGVLDVSSLWSFPLFPLIVPQTFTGMILHFFPSLFTKSGPKHSSRVLPMRLTRIFIEQYPSFFPFFLFIARKYNWEGYKAHVVYARQCQGLICMKIASAACGGLKRKEVLDIEFCAGQFKKNPLRDWRLLT